MSEGKKSLRERVGSFLLGKGAVEAPETREKTPEAAQGGPGRKSGPARMSYGRHGASTTLNSMVGWLVDGGNAEDGIDQYGAMLRKRSRDLFAGGGPGRSAPQTLGVAVTGWGIIPKPKVDGDFLGLSEEETEEAERAISREFKLWAQSPMCDAERQKNFYAMQQLGFLSMLMSGDCFGMFGMKENKRTPYKTVIRILEADRISTPESTGDSMSTETSGGGRIIDGVEINRDGEVIRYYISSRNSEAELDSSDLTWTAVDAFGADTGYPNILHVTTWERPEQRRGIPLIASEIETIKQFTRYMNAELAANVVSAMLAIFITSDEGDGKAGMEDAISEDEKVTDDELHLELAPGAIYDLPPGKSIQPVNPLRANTAFKDYTETMFKTMGSSVGIPKEVLLKQYESNYTAARAALLDFDRVVKVYRERFKDQFCQPVYEAVLAEAVASGRINAPGFFDDPLVRQAWSGCTWIGATLGHVDPLKEINAAAARVALNVSTEEAEAASYNGSDWNANIRQRKKELNALREIQEMLNQLGAGQNGNGQQGHQSQDDDQREGDEDE